MSFIINFFYADKHSTSVESFSSNCHALPQPQEIVSLPDGRTAIVDRVFHLTVPVAELGFVTVPHIVLRALTGEEAEKSRGDIRFIESIKIDETFAAHVKEMIDAEV